MPFENYNLSHASIQNLIISISSIAFSLAIVAAMYRIWKGPSDMDRLIGLEFLGGISASLAIWSALVYQHLSYLDVALAIATLSFIGTWVLSKWFKEEEAL
jgi:multicomponent Na+:H+ antiporter subunit F